MPRSRSKEFLHKSISAMITAIEAYNKPDHKYREETFSILALNAWELLFKAKILSENKNQLRKLYIYDKRRRKDGENSRRSYIRRNRSGNPMTISMGKAMGMIESEGLGNLSPALRSNLDALSEIRDNAAHMVNMRPDLSKAVQEFGTANIQNFVQLIKEWFNYDLSQYNFYLMPLAFFKDFDQASLVDLTTEETNLATYLNGLSQDPSVASNEDDYAVTLELNVRFKRSSLPTAARLALGNDPEAVPVTMTEEDIRNQYPWDYKELTNKLKDRYVNFKQNQKFNDIRKSLLDDKRYVMPRYLDPDNPSGAKKFFYSRNIINEFDKHYNFPESMEFFR